MSDLHHAIRAEIDAYQPEHAPPRQQGRELAHRGQAGGRAVRAEDPRAHAHRRGRPDHAQHVVEPRGPAEVVDEEVGAGADRGERGGPRLPPQRRRAGGVRAGGQQGRPARHPAEEEIGGDVPRPHGGLDDRPAVVRRELGLGHHRVRVGATAPLPAPVVAALAVAPLPHAGLLALAPVLLPLPGHHAGGRAVAGVSPRAAPARARLGVRGHRRAPAKAATAPATSAAAANPACRHITGRFFVGTTGSGGNP